MTLSNHYSEVRSTLAGGLLQPAALSMEPGSLQKQSWSWEGLVLEMCVREWNQMDEVLIVKETDTLETSLNKYLFRTPQP